MKKAIGVILIVLGSIVLLLAILVQNKGNNIEIISEIEGEPTGYQLILTAKYGGAGIDGQDLGSGTIIKKYNVSENDFFSEPQLGGVWRYNIGLPTILKIIQLQDDAAQINVYSNGKLNVINGKYDMEVKTINVKYNTDIEVLSNVSIADGKNYHYSIKIKKI